MTPYLITFLICGFLGWAIDTAYRSFVSKKYAPGTWLPFFSPIYATGGIILLFIFKEIPLSPPAQIIIGTICMILLEFVSGLISIKVLHKRFWSYKKSKYDLFGFIDLQHSFYWLILTALFRLIFQTLSL